MKIINGLIITLSITQILSANEFKLDVGSPQTILSGDIIDLNGKVLSGDKSKVDHYQWEENGEVLKNTVGDEIVYWDDANAENGYAPEGKGNHILKFVVVEESGKKHVKDLIVNVETESNATNEFKLDVGTPQTILLGDIIDLNGKVLSGDKSKIDHYQWEENGEILKNTAGNEIVYWDDANAENGYAPEGEGNHILKFVLLEESGKKHVKDLIVNVDKKDDAYIRQRKDMTFDLRPEFKVKTEVASWNNYHAFDGHYLDVKVGDIVSLSGIVSSSKKYLVDFYSWESQKGTILKNQLDDEIQYWDEENRENDYVPQEIGNEFLHFVVTDINGVRHSKTLLLKVTSKDINEDDHGNTMAMATEIELNKEVDALFETKGDHDFFKFTLDKKQNVKVVLNRRGTRKVKVLDSEGKAMPIEYSSVPGSALYRAKPTVFESGTYYVDASSDFGKYTLEVQAYDLNPIDEYPESPATEVFPGTIIKSHINSRKDVDCFYMNKNNMKTSVIKFEKEGTVLAEVKNRNEVCLKLPFAAYGRFPYTIRF